MLQFYGNSAYYQQQIIHILL